MHLRSVAVAIAAVALATVAGATVLAGAVPAQAGTLGVVVKVTPSQGLKPGQMVAVSGHGLPKSSGGSTRTWFVTECTTAVHGRMNPSTDTPHCDISDAQALRHRGAGHLQNAAAPAGSHLHHHDQHDPLTTAPNPAGQASCSHSRWLYPMIRPNPTPMVSLAK